MDASRWWKLASLHAGNDGFFAPELAHRFRDAFAGSGGKVTFVDAPAFGKDGHFLFSNSSAATWTSYVDNFLRAQNLLHRIAMDPVPAPPQLGASGKDAFAQYLGHVPHKAFAVAPDGSFGWRSHMPTVEDARREALEACSRHARGCNIYAIDDALSR